MFFELCIFGLSLYIICCTIWLKIVFYMYHHYNLYYKNTEFDYMYLFLCLSLFLNLIAFLNYAQTDFLTLTFFTTLSYIYLDNFFF